LYIHAKQKLKERSGSMLDVGRTMRDALSKWPEYYWQLKIYFNS